MPAIAEQWVQEDIQQEMQPGRITSWTGGGIV